MSKAITMGHRVQINTNEVKTSGTDLGCQFIMGGRGIGMYLQPLN